MNESTSNPAHISAYVPLLQFRPDAERVLRPYIDRLVDRFFAQHDVKEKPREVAQAQMLAAPDYSSKSGVEFKYFYDVLFDGIGKQKDGTIEHVVYTLTVDESLTPKYCEAADVYYGEVLLGGKPFFYYLRLDVQKLLRLLRQHALKPHYGKDNPEKNNSSEYDDLED